MEKKIQQDHDIHKEDEELIFNPYNSLNKEIRQKDVENLLKKYGINAPIFNFYLYNRAFIHKSYVKRAHLENIQNNIRKNHHPKVNVRNTDNKHNKHQRSQNFLSMR